MRVRISCHRKNTCHTVEGYPADISLYEFGVWLVRDSHNRAPAGLRGDRTLFGWGSDEEKSYALELALKDWRHHRQFRRKA